ASGCCVAGNRRHWYASAQLRDGCRELLFMLWYYVSETQERIAVPESRMPAIVSSGAIQPTTPVRRKGMSAWVSAGEAKPGLFAAPAAGGAPPQTAPSARTPVAGAEAAEESASAIAGAAGLLHEITTTLRRYSGWMHVSAGMYFATGV